MCASRFNAICSGISNSYQRTKSWISEKIESEPVLTLRKKLDGAGDAVKTALGAHYIFDLGMSILPGTGPWYTGFKIIKYTCTGVTFGVTAYVNQAQRAKAKNVREKLKKLGDLLTLIDKKFGELFSIIVQAEELLKIAGFSSNDLSSLQQEWEAHEKTISSELTVVGRSSFFSSKPCLVGKSGFNASIRASMVNYAFDLGAEVIPVTRTYLLLKDILIGMTLAVASIREYERATLDVAAQTELENLKSRIDHAHQKMQFIKEKLGSEEALEKILRDASLVTHIPAHTGIPMPENKEETSRLLELANSKWGSFSNSVINGAATGSSFHYLFDVALPAFPAVKYIAGGVSWLISIGMQRKKMNADLVFNEEIKGLDTKLSKAQNLLSLAEKILIHQREYVRQLGGTPMEPVDAAESKESDADAVLAANFDDDIFSRDYDYALLEEGTYQPASIELGVLSQGQSMFAHTRTAPPIHSNKLSITSAFLSG